MTEFQMTITGKRASGKTTILRQIKEFLIEQGYVVKYDWKEQRSGETESMTIRSSFGGIDTLPKLKILGD